MPFYNRSLDTLMNIIPLLLVFCNKRQVSNKIQTDFIAPSKSPTPEKIGQHSPQNDKYDV